MKLAVIPARGGSKRIPKKNIRDFHGLPMIAYAIKAAVDSGLFDNVVVSTDSDEISSISVEYGASAPFRRPDHLSDDLTPTVPVISHAIKMCKEIGMVFSEVCCIYPCVPFILHEDLIAAYDLLSGSGVEFVFPVAPYPSPIQRAILRDNAGASRPYYPEYVNTRTQDLSPAYFDVGQFYWGRESAWLAGLNIHMNSRTIVIPETRVVDIDTMEDWRRAELLYPLLKKKNPV